MSSRSIPAPQIPRRHDSGRYGGRRLHEHRLARGAGTRSSRPSCATSSAREAPSRSRRAGRSRRRHLLVSPDRPAWLERLRYPLHYAQYVRVQARENHLDPALFAAVIYQESKFRSDARSSLGAIGLMQLTPSTARDVAIRTGGSRFTTNDLYDPEINIRYGAWYLENLFYKYGTERLVLAAYNAGRATSTGGAREVLRFSFRRRSRT